MQTSQSRRDVLKACAASALSVVISGCGEESPVHQIPSPEPIAEHDGPPADLKPVWQRIVDWHEKHAPGKFKLNPGAKSAEIDALEGELGVKLPADVRASLLLHNGGRDDTWLLWHGELLTIAGILEQWKLYSQMQARGEYAVLGHPDWRPREISGTIKPIWWNTNRIHLTDNSGEHLTVDLDPPSNGTHGQIILLGDVGPTKVLAKSWSAFLTQLADDLEAGKYYYDEKEETVLQPGM